ncbi:MAG: hypothetical protein AVDCRST_MAG90-347, partial [uncultured Microvirga sp.]
GQSAAFRSIDLRPARARARALRGHAGASHAGPGAGALCGDAPARLPRPGWHPLRHGRGRDRRPRRCGGPWRARPRLGAG